MHVAAGGVLGGPDADRVLRNGIEGPKQIAVVGIVGFDKAANAVFAAVGADQDFAVDRGRRHRLAVAQRRIGNLLLPCDVAGLGVECHQHGVEGGDIDLVLIDRHAAIIGAAAIGRDRPHIVLVVPVHLAGLRIERVDVIEGCGDIHHPVDDERRGLQRLADIGLENPGNVQSLDVGTIDLLGRIEALLFVVAIGGEKISAVVGSAVEHRLGDGRRWRRRLHDGRGRRRRWRGGRCRSRGSGCWRCGRRGCGGCRRRRRFCCRGWIRLLRVGAYDAADRECERTCEQRRHVHSLHVLSPGIL